MNSEMIQTKLYLLSTGHVLQLYAALNSPLITPGLPSPMYAKLQSPRMTNMDSTRALAMDARMHSIWTEIRQFRPDTWNSLFQYIAFLAPSVEEFPYISFFCDSDSHRLYPLLHWLRPIMWIWLVHFQTRHYKRLKDKFSPTLISFAQSHPACHFWLFSFNVLLCLAV